MTSYVIVAHRADPDGIISHALLRRAIGENNIRAHYFVDYDDIMPSLITINQKNNDAEIIVADISCNNQFMDEALFADLKKKNKSITWIDHHDSTADNSKFLGQFCTVIYAANKCAAELVEEKYRSRLYYSDPYYSHILAEIAHAHDFEQRKTLPWKAGDSLQQVIASGYNLETLVKDLANGRAWEDNYTLSPHYSGIAAHFKLKKMEAYYCLKETVEQIDCAGKKVLFAFADPMLYMKDAPEYLKLYYDTDYIVVAFESISNVAVFGKGNVGKSVVDFCIAMGGGGRGHGGGINLNHPVSKESYPADKEYITSNLNKFLLSYSGHL